MSDDTSNIIEGILMLIYNFALLAGSAYLVVAHNWSLWTFLGAVVFMVSIKDKK